jgi:hypothetical protein
MAKPSRSEADAQWVYIALKRGFPEAAIAAELASLSEKAQGKNGPRYIERTIREVREWIATAAPPAS